MSTPGTDDEVPRYTLALAATVVYGIFVCVAVLWLWLREREQRLSELALGDYSAVVSLAIGTVAGLGLSGVIFLLVRYLRVFRSLDDRLRETVGPLTESEIVVIAMASAIGEEMLFRGALQDQVGPYFSALVFGALHTGPGLLLWGIVAAALGLVFGLMVEAGCGLLSVTVAHALINFISLRRMVLK